MNFLIGILAIFFALPGGNAQYFVTSTTTTTKPPTTTTPTTTQPTTTTLKPGVCDIQCLYECFKQEKPLCQSYLCRRCAFNSSIWETFDQCLEDIQNLCVDPNSKDSIKATNNIQKLCLDNCSIPAQIGSRIQNQVCEDLTCSQCHQEGTNDMDSCMKEKAASQCVP